MTKYRVTLLDWKGDHIWRGTVDADPAQVKADNNVCPGAVMFDHITFIPIAQNTLVIEEMTTGESMRSAIKDSTWEE